jgi:lactate 2-monooxygenase
MMALNWSLMSPDTPILMAPIGVQALFHNDKETGLAEVCSEINVPFIMSTAASASIEEVAAANGDGHRWYQLYWPEDNNLTQSLLRRAKSNGFKVLVVTLDTPGMAWRPADLDRAYIPFIRGIGCDVGFSDPVFRAKFEKENDGAKIEDEVMMASTDWMGAVFGGPWKKWEDLKLLRETWDGPIVLKGIQHAEDAKKAYEYGCQGIIVSNHGGESLVFFPRNRP